MLERAFGFFLITDKIYYMDALTLFACRMIAVGCILSPIRQACFHRVNDICKDLDMDRLFSMECDCISISKCG